MDDWLVFNPSPCGDQNLVTKEIQIQTIKMWQKECGHLNKYLVFWMFTTQIMIDYLSYLEIYAYIISCIPMQVLHM
jgi:hypothetical protein